ncbi:MAG: response regulator transcription factor [Alphaproteobacteria bacterium]|nr:response regulator transcription factor [Alphaproteobacteria bacterium]
MKNVIGKGAAKPMARDADAISLFRENRPVRVIVTDERRLCRECLRLLIATFDPSLEVAEANDPAEILTMLNEDPGFSVVLYNLVVRGEEGVEFVRGLRSSVPDIPLIVLCDFDDPEVMRGVMASGAKAFLPSTTPSSVMVAVLRLVIAGGTYAPANMVLGESPGGTATGTRARGDREALIEAHFPQLTPRQRHVLALLSHGYMNRDIAGALGMCENTVKAHVKQVMRKLNASNRTQAALMADRLVA